MASTRWFGCLAVLATLTWVPTRTASAGHCEYCNAGLPTSVAIKTPEIGIDGVIVIVLEDDRGRVLDQTSWDITTVTVTDPGGALVDGALETHPGFSPAAWRPTNPWVPGTYQVTVAVDLPSFPADPGPTDCPGFSHQAEIVVVDEPRHVVGTQALSVVETLGVTPLRSLETLVCCDGALPYEASVPGIGCPDYPSRMLEIGAGHCSELLSTGWLALEAELLIDGQPAPPDYSLREVTHDSTTASGDAVMSMKLTQPECLQFELLDLVTGELTVHDSCHGDAVADQLGTLELDPTNELAAACSGGAYVCEAIGYSWDPTACTTWPDGAPYMHPNSPESESPPADPNNGGCRIGTPSSPAAAGMLVLALLGLRRVRRRLR
jgi:MYXO-CTERM domain-containing protein